MNKARRKTLRQIDFNDIRAKIETLKLALENAKECVEDVKNEEGGSRENLPEGLQDGEQGEAMLEAVDHMETLVEALDEAVTALDEVSVATETFENDFAW